MKRKLLSFTLCTLALTVAINSQANAEVWNKGEKPLISVYATPTFVIKSIKPNWNDTRVDITLQSKITEDDYKKITAVMIDGQSFDISKFNLKNYSTATESDIQTEDAEAIKALKDAGLSASKVSFKEKSSTPTVPAVATNYTMKKAFLKDNYGDITFSLEPLKDGKQVTEADGKEADIEINGTNYGKLGDLISRYFYGEFRITDLEKIKKEISEDKLKVKLTFKDGQVLETTVNNELSTEQRAKITGKKVTPVAVDKADLEKVIKEVEALDTSKKTEASVKVLTDAIAKAKVIDKKVDATQEEVDDAKKAITEAKDALKDKPVVVVPVVDKADLEKVIKEAEALDTSKKTDASVKVLTDAIAKAKTIDKKVDATQEEVDDAKKAITEAKDALKDKAVATPTVIEYKIDNGNSKFRDTTLEISVTDKLPSGKWNSYLHDDKDFVDGTTISINGKDFGLLKDLMTFKYGTYKLKDLKKIKEVIKDAELKVELRRKDGKVLKTTIKNTLTDTQKKKILGEDTTVTPVVPEKVVYKAGSSLKTFLKNTGYFEFQLNVLRNDDEIVYGTKEGQAVPFMEGTKIEINGHDYGTMKELGMNYGQGSFRLWGEDGLKKIKDVIKDDELKVKLSPKDGAPFEITVKNSLTKAEREEITGKNETIPAVSENYTIKKASLKDNYGTVTFSLEPLKGGKQVTEVDGKEATVEINGTNYGKLGDLISRYFYGEFRITDLEKIKKEISKDELKVKLTFKDGKTVETTVKNELTSEQRKKIVGEDTTVIPEPVVVDKTELEKTIKIAEKIDTTNKTEASVKALTDAIAEAKTVDAKKDATEKEVKAAKEKLQKAIDALVAIPIDKSKLETTIKKVEKLNEKDYTPVSYENLKKKLADARAMLEKENATQEEIDKVNADLEKAFKDLEIALIDLEREYGKYADAFVYTNKTIVDRAGEDAYFNVKGGVVSMLERAGRSAEKKNKKDRRVDHIIGGIQAGMSKQLDINKNYRVGAFVEFDNELANHYMIGATLKYKDSFKGFARYRLANYEGVKNNNIDLYGNYSRRYNLSNSSYYEPSLGLYLTYSGKTKLDDKVNLESRFAYLVDASVKAVKKYDEGLEVYIKPELRAGNNDQKLIQVGTSNSTKIKKSELRGSVEVGVSKAYENGITPMMNVRVKSNKQKEVGVDLKLGASYKF